MLKSRLNKYYTLDTESLDLEYFNRTPSKDCAVYVRNNILSVIQSNIY